MFQEFLAFSRMFYNLFRPFLMLFTRGWWTSYQLQRVYTGSKVLVVFNLKLQPRWPVAEQFSRYVQNNKHRFLTFSIKKSKMAKGEIETNKCLTLLLNE